MRIALAFERDPRGALYAIFVAIVPQGDVAISVEIDTSDFKAETGIDFSIDVPGDISNFIIRIRAY